MAEKMELGGRGCSRVEKSNLGECVKIMTKKLWCYSPNKSQKECARKFVALRWQTKNYHVHSLCVGWRNHAEVTPGMAYKKPKRILGVQCISNSSSYLTFLAISIIIKKKFTRFSVLCLQYSKYPKP